MHCSLLCPIIYLRDDLSTGELFVMQVCMLTLEELVAEEMI